MPTSVTDWQFFGNAVDIYIKITSFFISVLEEISSERNDYI